MATFSIYDGLDKQTVSYFLGGSYSTGSYNVDFILESLKDNTTKLLTESDLRTSVFSIASSNILKETIATNSTISYIGIDTLNTNGTSSNVSLRDIKDRKFLIGKRSYSGTYSYDNSDDIFHQASTYSLLSSDTDIFFYNTKSDLVDNNLIHI